MKKEMKYKVLLCLLAGSVLSVNTALAAEYTETISGANDTSYNAIKVQNGNEYTYNFNKGDSLKLTDSTNGIIIDNNNVDSITVNNSLDLYMDNTNYDVWKSSVMAGIVINNASEAAIRRNNGGDITINVNDCDGKRYSEVSGVKIANGTSNNTIEIGNSQINVNVLKAQYGVMARGLSAEGTNNKIVMGDGLINVTAESVLNEKGVYYVDAYAVAAYNKTEIKTGDVDITATAIGNEFVTQTLVNGIDAELGESTVTIGNGDVIATAVSTGASYANAIYAGGGATVTKGNGNIIAKAEGTGEGTGNIAARGIFANNGTVNVAVADIKAETTGGDSDSKSIGLLGQNNGEINFAGGSIAASADNEEVYVAAISAYDDSVINVNQGTANRVVINGNVDNYGDGAINLNLNTSDSVLTGSIKDENGTLNLENGARWIATEYSEVNELTMNQGNIYVETPRTGDIKISNYDGVGNILFKADDTDKEGVVNIDTSSVTFTNAEEGSFINVGIANNTINTLDIDKTEENLQELAGKVYYKGNNDNLNGKVVIKEGLITPEASGELRFDSANNNRGYVANITGGNRVTQTMDAMKHIAETAIVAWRQEDSTLSQRLGDLRESDGGQGIWVRMSRGEFNYDGQYENQYNFFQLGYDWARGNWHYGAAVSHNDGETTYAQGTGENRSTSLSLYGTWLGRKGHYADIVLKQGRLSNDFDIYTEAGHTHGDYDMWGTSFSGEYGRKIDLKDGWYVTPQAQMTLMRIGGEDFTTNNGIHVRQDSLESAVGRVGFEVGKAFDKKGSIYAKASLLHDFAGSADTYLSLKGLSNSYSQDIGDTWWEAGLGFNYKVNDSSYLYADVVKTFGGDVETPWQWNVGMRWAFV
ncbi:autotransporter outer membrane beta-barrel domain-containing protein [Megasphaera stantonii]|uniref:autotransporter outer membrane beta-barrel domain-containing protein n=1 Tax=Megasphaera stantonii TaxID=2144175 RepID=UPI001D37503A|nr:autotransporter outer membrane beta-barrel domain-containing protein [Megasphaera stantonii]HJE83305.1 autotransporter outer membrane beta-barrel domain-containing protein [Megasphaera stantonii]